MNKLFNQATLLCFAKQIKRYFYVLIAVFISAINYNLLIYPSKIVAGGGNGLSIIVESLFKIKPSFFILIFSTTVLTVSICLIGFRKSSGALLATFIYPLFVELTSGISTIISPNSNDMLLISIFAGIIGGLASGIIYKTGFSGGGISLISKMIYEKLHISVSATSFCMNLLIVCAGGMIYGPEIIMYAIIYLYIDRIVVDRVLLGISSNKVFYIVTNNNEKVKEFLTEKLKYQITEFEVVGGYKSTINQIIMIAVPTKEYFKITDEIKKIDKKAFFVVTDAYQMYHGS